MRSGAASNPACRRLPGDLFDMHAGCRCPSSKNRYIKHTMKDRLSVSKSLLFQGYTLRWFTVYSYLAEKTFLVLSLRLLVVFGSL